MTDGCICQECGGSMCYEVSSTRWTVSRRRFELIPCLPIKTCTKCGAQWMTTEELHQLAAIVEKPRFCEVCVCENCRNGDTQHTDYRIRTTDGRWWCDVCYEHDAKDPYSPLWPRPPWVQVETKEEWERRLEKHVQSDE